MDGRVHKRTIKVVQIFRTSSYRHTLQETSVSHLGKRKIIDSKAPCEKDMSVPWRIYCKRSSVCLQQKVKLRENPLPQSTVDGRTCDVILSIYLPICVPVCLSMYLCIYLFSYLPTCPSFCLSIYPSIYCI